MPSLSRRGTMLLHNGITMQKKWLMSVTTMLLLSALVPQNAHAFAIITTGIPGCNFATGDVHANCVIAFIAHVIRQIFSLSAALSFIAIIWGGYEYALGNMVGGKEKGLTRLRWGIIGMIMSAFSLFILSFVIRAFTT